MLMDEELITTVELARYLKVNKETILRKVRKGELPAVRMGRGYRFSRRKVDRWIAECNAGRKVEILVIDDEPIIGELLRDSLGICGYNITTTASSREGVALIGEKSYDLVFLDLVMPELDGSEVFRRIREIDGGTRVAIITSYSDSELMMKAMEYGPFMVIKKPFSVVELIEAVRCFSRTGAVTE